MIHNKGIFFMSETKTLDRNSSVQRNPDMIFTGFGSEMVMLSMQDSCYYGINEVGVRIWELIESRMSIAGIIEAICDEFDAGAQQCEQDVQAFVAQLLHKNMATLC